MVEVVLIVVGEVVVAWVIPGRMATMVGVLFLRGLYAS